MLQIGSIAESPIFQRLFELGSTDSEVRRLIPLVERVVTESCDRLKSVIRYMPEYTLHDETHVLNVVGIMGHLLPDATLRQLQPLELASSILAAALHDVGMAPPESEVSLLLGAHPEMKHSAPEVVSYQGLRQSHPELLRRQRDLRSAEQYHAAQEIEAFLLAEHIRKTHAARSRKYVFERYQDEFVYRNFSFAHLIADICFSHTQNHEYLERLPIDQLLGQGEYFNGRFVAVLLRLADILDFDAERTPAVLFQQLGVRNVVSLAEWRKHSAIVGWDIRPRHLAFAAQSPDPVIEKSIRDFLAMMDEEVRACQVALANSISVRTPNYATRYNLPLPTGVDSRGVGPAVGPDGPLYKFIDVGFTLDQQSIQALLMGVNLYAQPFLFLRELLQNAVDACRHRASLHAANKELGAYIPTVVVRLLEEGENHFLEIEDNGMGMDEWIVRKFFARVGVSYYKSPDFTEEKVAWNLDFKPVSQFGIGVLSAFMVTERITVETKRIGHASAPLSIEIAGKGELFWFQNGKRRSPGTTLRLRLDVPLDDLLLASHQVRDGSSQAEPSLTDRFVGTLDEVAPHIDIPIMLEIAGDRRQHVQVWKELPAHFRQFRPSLRFVDIDLTGCAPARLNGTCTVVLLEEDGRLVFQRSLRGDCYRIEDYIQVRRQLGAQCEFLTYSGGTLHKMLLEDLSHEGTRGTRQSGTVALYSDGRWSQQGFGVPYPLFVGQAGRYSLRIPKPVTVFFPFPIWFDIDLSGDFVLPLTADRRNVLSSDYARHVCVELSALLIRALLESLGRDIVSASEDFFRRALWRSAPNSADQHVQILETFLGEDHH